MKTFLKKNFNSDSFPKILFIFSLCVLSFIYGFFAFPLKWFPYSLIEDAVLYIDEKIKEPEKPKHYVKSDYATRISVYNETLSSRR